MLLKTLALVLCIVQFSILSQSVSAGNSSDAAFKRIMSMIQNEDYFRGKKSLLKLIKKNPENGLYWFNLGSLYLMLEDYSRAGFSFEKAAKHSKKMRIPALLFHAKSLNMTKKYKRAIRILQRLKKINLPENITNEIKVELRHARNQRNLRVAMNYYLKKEYHKSVRTLQGHEGLHEDTDALKLLAFSYIRMNNFAQARRLIRRLRKISLISSDKKMSLKLLGKLRNLENEYEQRDNLFLDFALGYDSNFLTSNKKTSKNSASYKIASLYEKRLKDIKQSKFSILLGMNSESTFSDPEKDNISGYLISPSFQFINGKNEFKVRPFFSHQFSEFNTLMIQSNLNLQFINSSFFNHWGIESDHTKNHVINDTFSYLNG